MSSELRSRVAVTVALLTAVHALRAIPVPGIDMHAGSFTIVNPRMPWLWLPIPFQASVGGAGILPYLAASALASTVALLTGRTEQYRGRRAEVQATIVAVLGALAIGARNHVHNVYGLEAVTSGAAGFGIIVTALTQAAGTLVTIGAARAISTAGIGNGACLIGAAEILHGQAAGLLLALHTSTLNPQPVLREHAVAFTLTLVALLVVAVVFLEARWRMQEWSGSVTSLFPAGAVWNISGVGIAGIRLASSVLDVVTLGIAAFSNLTIPEPWTLLLTPGRAWAATFLLTSLALSVLYTAWAFDPRVASRLIARAGGTFDLEAFDRRVVRVLIPAAFVMCVVVVVFRVLTVRLGATDFINDAVSAVLLLPVVAIVLDTARQWRTHVAISNAVDISPGDRKCGSCGARTEDADEFCGACGGAFAESVPCARHPEAVAMARCIVCRETACAACARTSGRRLVCDRHAGVQFVEGWAVAAIAETGLEVDLRKAQLGLAGIQGIVLSNTTSPLCATFGLFEINPIVPLVPHRECGGGGYRLLVAPENWESAVARLSVDGEASPAGPQPPPA